MRVLIALGAPLLLSACFSDEPGTQCLKSFKSNLKDPDSGKVIDFTPPTLTYSATNSYGARIQGKALCIKSSMDGSWHRDSNAEALAVLQRSTDKMNKASECMKIKKSFKVCENEVESQVIWRKGFSEHEINDVHEESRRELGF